MKLTDKCKVDFEKWFWVNPENNIGLKKEQLLIVKKAQLKIFYDLTNSMKYGVYVDYFDSVNLPININCYGNGESWQYDIATLPMIYDANSREEARDKAIEKANEIRNEQL